MNKLSMYFKSRAFKRGSFSAALTVIVIAAVLILNVIVTALAHKYYWYIDMTKDSVFKVSEEGMAIIEGIDDEINIIFCDAADTLQANLYQKSVYNTALELSARFDNIKIKHLDIYKNPSSIAKYKMTASTAITASSVIIESGSEFRVYPLTAFFVFNDESYQDAWAYNGEYKLISAILQVTADEFPKAYFTIGHGERLVDQALWNLFAEAGYQVNTINLMEEDLAEDTRFLIINDPIYDFQGISADTAGKRSEIEKIDDFLDDFGCLMVFTDPDTGELPELYSFLREWGISFGEYAVKDYDHSLTTDGYSISAQYAVGQTTGASLVSPITELAAPPKAIVRYATPINIEFTDNGTRNVSAVLTTSHDALLSDENDINVGAGKYNLMTLSRETRYIDNQAQYSYVLAAGTTNFATNDYIGQKAYANSDILYSAMKQMGKERVPVNLDFKPFDNTELDITASEATSWTIIIITVLPIIAILFCIVILIRRKHR
ncbi:MAG: Gldg family protein [Clostridia bacterium]|nr:Gldg family protein [Clostridia bacterium]